MPLYEYICKDCGVKFESLRSMKDADTSITCKHCLGKNTIRVLSVFNASSGGRSITSSNGCGSCASDSCSSCGHSH